MSLQTSQIFDDQNELSTKIYKDLESIIGCAQEIDCLIEYLQGSQPQLVNIGLNKLFTNFNHSNLMHLEIKQQSETTVTTQQSVQGAKSESIKIVLEVQKSIINRQIQQTLNYYIDKNLAQFNIPYQLNQIDLEQCNIYSNELLQDLFSSDEQIQNQFIQRKCSLKESSLLRRSLSINQIPTKKSVILEKIDYRKSTMIKKLELRFPKLESVEPIIPYILALYINIESEGLIGDFQQAKNKLKSIHHTVLKLSFSNFMQLLSTEYVKLFVKLDMQQIIKGNFNTQFQIQSNKILTQQKWVKLDKSKIQELLQSSKFNQQFQIENQKLQQLEELIQSLNQKIILLFQQILPHEQGGFDNNYQIVDQLLLEIQQSISEMNKSSSINQEITIAINKIFQQIIYILNKFKESFQSKFGINTLNKLKLILQENNKKLIKQKLVNEYQYKCVCELENQLLNLQKKKQTILTSSELISLIVESIEKNVEFEGILSDLKYGNETQSIISEVSQIQDYISNDQVKQFLQNVIDYFQDRIKKKDINFNLNQLQLTQHDESILKSINNQYLIKYIKENQKVFKTISKYLLANDPSINLTLRQYTSLQELSILALKFSKDSNLNQFFRLFIDFKNNLDSQQIRLKYQLSSNELSEWKNFVQLFE
ncbi:unnamed protein product [Paramecium pentaurelia]|uniref:Uncharacterized protein n=1 Tax=Paramecium pentaurelia TaxID=43138 RepID=A0A8S1YGT3_9CILI|nr:unnamed protein product [Paramecium pentaurelia]